VSKKNWIKIKIGLSQDPKHREAMGNRIWLFMHMTDKADWTTGKVDRWRDTLVAAEMGMEIRTLRQQRRELCELEYITCIQHHDYQEIIIHKWVDPRTYGDEVLNIPGEEGFPKNGTPKKKGYKKMEPEGDIKNVTPTYSSGLKDSGMGASAPEPLTVEKYKDRISKALASGIAMHNGFTGAIEFEFHIRPTWNTKTARAFVEYMAVEWQPTADDVHRFAQWWRQNDWRGQKGQAPSLKDIRENWPQAFVSDDGNLSYRVVEE